MSGETATEQVARTVALNVAQDGPPTAVTGSAGDQKITVAWTAPVIVTSATVTSYTATSTPGSFTCVTTTTSCVVSGLTNGTAYTFVVRVTYSDSNTRDSSASGATTAVYTAPAPEPESSGEVATPAAPTPTPYQHPGCGREDRSSPGFGPRPARLTKAGSFTCSHCHRGRTPSLLNDDGGIRDKNNGSGRWSDGWCECPGK